MITQNTHQPTPDERKNDYDWNKRGYEHLNPQQYNIFSKQFNKEQKQ